MSTHDNNKTRRCVRTVSCGNRAAKHLQMFSLFFLKWARFLFPKTQKCLMQLEKCDENVTGEVTLMHGRLRSLDLLHIITGNSMLHLRYESTIRFREVFFFFEFIIC